MQFGRREEKKKTKMFCVEQLSVEAFFFFLLLQHNLAYPMSLDGRHSLIHIIEV